MDVGVYICSRGVCVYEYTLFVCMDRVSVEEEHKCYQTIIVINLLDMGHRRTLTGVEGRGSRTWVLCFYIILRTLEMWREERPLRRSLRGFSGMYLTSTKPTELFFSVWM